MKISSKIKAILFDLDDTLLDSQLAQYNAICDFRSSFNEFDIINKQDFAEIWGKITAKCYERYLKKEISFQDTRNERMKELFLAFDIVIEDKEAKEKFNIYQDLYKKNWILFNDAIEVLNKLEKKYMLAIVSNGDGVQQREKLKKTGIEKYFSQIIISSEVGFSKPNKEIFEIVCKKVNVKPEECIMIGDKFKTDIEGSINSGMNAIWVNRKNEHIDYKYKIKELCELL